MTVNPPIGPYGSGPTPAYPPSGPSSSGPSPAGSGANAAPYPPPPPGYPPANVPQPGPGDWSAGPAYPPAGPPPAAGPYPAGPPWGQPTGPGPAPTADWPAAPPAGPLWTPAVSDQPVTHLVRRRRYEPLTGAIWAVALVAVQILRWMPGLSNDVNYWLLVNLRFISNSAGPLVFTFGWLALTVIGLIVVVRTFLARQPFHAVITHPNGLGLIKEAGQAPTWYTWGQLSIAVRTHEGVTTSVGVRPPGQREFSITPRALPDFPIFLERLRYFTS